MKAYALWQQSIQHCARALHTLHVPRRHPRHPFHPIPTPYKSALALASNHSMTWRASVRTVRVPVACAKPSAEPQRCTIFCKIWLACTPIFQNRPLRGGREAPPAASLEISGGAGLCVCARAAQVGVRGGSAGAKGRQDYNSRTRTVILRFVQKQERASQESKNKAIKIHAHTRSRP